MATANWCEMSLSRATFFQSMVFIGWGIDRLDDLRLNLMVEETIRWSDPIELKEE
jgi:hypothetical protein